MKVSYLLTAVHNTSLAEDARQMSAVLLRRLFSTEFTDFYDKLPPESKAQLKEQVLLAIQLPDQTEQLRHKICDIAAEVARNLIDVDGNNEWPEFLQVLSQITNRNLSLTSNIFSFCSNVPTHRIRC